MRGLISIDPGVHRTGWAWFDDERRLRDAGVVRASDIPSAVAGSSRFRAFVAEGRANVDILIECPVIYPNVRAAGDPNDVLAVAIVAGAYGGALVQFGALAYVKPATWKGQTPKKVTHARAMGALDSDEFLVWCGRVSPFAETNGRLDVADAIALGLWKLGRMPV